MPTVRLSVLLLLTASGCCLSVVQGEDVGSDTMATSVPDPNPTSVSLTVSDADGAIYHVQVILTVNQ